MHLRMSTLEEVQLLRTGRKNGDVSDVPYFMTPVDQIDVANLAARTDTNGREKTLGDDAEAGFVNVGGTALHDHLLEQQQQQQQQQHLQNLPPFVQKILDKVGKIDESRIVSSREYRDEEVPQLFR